MLFGKIEGKWDKMELHVNEKKADFMPFQIGQPVVFKTRSEVLRLVFNFSYLGFWIASSEEVDSQQEKQN